MNLLLTAAASPSCASPPPTSLRHHRGRSLRHRSSVTVTSAPAPHRRDLWRVPHQHYSSSLSISFAGTSTAPLVVVLLRLTTAAVLHQTFCHHRLPDRPSQTLSTGAATVTATDHHPFIVSTARYRGCSPSVIVFMPLSTVVTTPCPTFTPVTVAALLYVVVDPTVNAVVTIPSPTHHRRPPPLASLFSPLFAPP